MIVQSTTDPSRHVDRAVAIMTRSTQALLRANDETALLGDICRIAVETAGYGLAWVGYLRPGANVRVVPMAAAGPARALVDRIDARQGDGGPISTAIASDHAVVVADIAAAPDCHGLGQMAVEHDLRSLVVLPLTLGPRATGALMIHAAEADAFDADTVRLLEDLARNLSYGISTMRIRVEHDHAVRELADSEERYRSLVDLSPDGILVHEQGCVLFANPAAAQVFGMAQDRMIGTHLLDLLPDDEHPRLLAHLSKQRTDTLRTEMGMRRADGTCFHAEVVASSVTFHGAAARLLMIRDVTARRHVDEQLIQAAKLATLGEMAAGLVHELSQPLNVIRLTAEGALLFIERGKATAEWQAQQFALIATQTQRTAEIIDDIRIFSRRDDSPVQVFDAVAAIRSAIGVLLGQITPDGIALNMSLPPRPVAVRGRRVQLEQVVMNLLSNAHHALRELRERLGRDNIGGAITVTAEPKGTILEIQVADTGPGIAPHLRDRIFEPFFTTKEAGRGTGLGLSVSFGIIAAMGGRLELAPPADQAGACFVVSLPVDKANPLPAPDSPSVAPPQLHRDGHVMVVDDERAALDTLGHHLAALGYRVSLASSGQQAFDLFMADPADVVITDLRMPLGGGEQLIERLRDFDPLLPIVVVTGHLGATERLAANLQDDRCAMLKKPVALVRLDEIISAFLLPPGEEEIGVL